MNKIILFINGLTSGGAEHQLVELANGLMERGYDVTITTFSDVSDHYKYSPQIKRHQIAQGRSRLIKLLGIFLYFFFLKADCVISFGQRENYFCLIPLWFRSSKKIRVIAGERNTTVGPSSSIERKLLDKYYQRADFIVPNSFSQRNYIIKVKPEYTRKTITITNFTNLKDFTASPLPGGEKLSFVVFGRYDKQKNCIRFAEAIHDLKKRSDRAFVVEWYGNQSFKDKEPNPFYQEMNNKVIELGLQDTLILKDQTKDVSSIMKKYDAFCLPSLWEGFSNAIGEAICCGRPCLVSDVSDNGVMVQNGLNGFLFDPQSTDDIVVAFLKFFSLTEDGRMKMGLESRKRAETLFNKERFVSSYEKLINSEI